MAVLTAFTLILQLSFITAVVVGKAAPRIKADLSYASSPHGIEKVAANVQETEELDESDVGEDVL